MNVLRPLKVELPPTEITSVPLKCFPVLTVVITVAPVRFVPLKEENAVLPCGLIERPPYST